MMTIVIIYPCAFTQNFNLWATLSPRTACFTQEAVSIAANLPNETRQPQEPLRPRRPWGSIGVEIWLDEFDGFYVDITIVNGIYKPTNSTRSESKWS